jgi:hypothetical protein
MTSDEADKKQVLIILFGKIFNKLKKNKGLRLI